MTGVPSGSCSVVPARVGMCRLLPTDLVAVDVAVAAAGGMLLPPAPGCCLRVPPGWLAAGLPVLLALERDLLHGLVYLPCFATILQQMVGTPLACLRVAERVMLARLH